jgi:hypothetical protein
VLQELEKVYDQVSRLFVEEVRERGIGGGALEIAQVPLDGEADEPAGEDPSLDQVVDVLPGRVFHARSCVDIKKTGGA